MFSFMIRLLALLCLLSGSLSAWAAKTDIVFLKNGDRVTGEVKSLGKAKLEFSTDHMGTVYIEWTDILQIVSDTGQTVELSNGQRFFGPLAKPENEDMVVVRTEQGPVAVSTLDVVSMYPVEAGFWDRLDISASLGFSWDKASEVGKYNIGIDTELRNPRFISRASFNSEITTQHWSSMLRGRSVACLTIRMPASLAFASLQNSWLATSPRTMASRQSRISFQIYWQSFETNGWQTEKQSTYSISYACGATKPFMKGRMTARLRFEVL